MTDHSNHTPRLVALQGSVRPGNYTAKALAVVADAVRQQGGVSLEIIDPTNMDLRLPGQGTSDDVRRMQETVAAADGVILATPEYHGSFSSVVKLLIDNLGFPSKLSGKPVALLGVAAGRIGAVKALEHLRCVASHVGALVLPGPISVARVRTVFDEDGHILNEDAVAMIRRVPIALIDYINRHVCPAFTLEAMVRLETEG